MVGDSLKKYYYVMALGVGAAFVTLLLALFVISPLFSTVSKMNSEKDSISATLTGLKNKQAALNALKSQETQLETDSQTVSNALPSQADIGRLFIQLDSIAKVAGGNLKSVVQTTSATGQGLAGINTQEYSIPLEMPSYFAFKQFVTNAQSALRLLSLENIKLDATDAGAMTVSIAAKAYSRAN